MNNNHINKFIIGRRIRVIKEFSDYDKINHLVGEEWLFMGHGFVPYHDGFTIKTDRFDIRLHWTKDGQGEIIENLQLYLEMV
jgi:hypothetical protein